VKVGEGGVCKGERGAFRAGGDNISTVTAIVGSTRAIVGPTRGGDQDRRRWGRVGRGGPEVRHARRPEVEGPKAQSREERVVERRSREERVVERRNSPGTNCTCNRCERTYSLHSNEVSLFTMRLDRGRE
jgi:hypothetical protein